MKHVMCKVEQDGKWSLVVDGNEGKKYDDVLGWQFYFDSDTAFHYLAMKDGKLYMVEEKLK